MATDYNVTRRVTVRGGWIGLLSGESQGKALTRCLTDLNRDGYRVVFILPDKWNFVWLVQTWILAILTLGFVVLTPNLLVVGEPIPETQNYARAAE